MDRPRLFLLTPPVTEAARFAPLLATAVGAVDVACVLLRLAAPDPRAGQAIVRALLPITLARDVALLVEDDVRLAVRAGADGVHLGLGDGPALGEALAALKPDGIVGAGGLGDRDAAMRAGEAGADYVMFEGEGVVEMASWWAEIFNVPCVAVANRVEDVADLARTGAEFVALGGSLWDAPDSIAVTLRAAAAALAPLPEAAR